MQYYTKKQADGRTLVFNTLVVSPVGHIIEQMDGGYYARSFVTGRNFPNIAKKEIAINWIIAQHRNSSASTLRNSNNQQSLFA